MTINFPDEWGVKKYERDSQIRIKYDDLTPEKRIALIRDIVNQHQYQKINSGGKNDVLDGFTASAIVRVYDAVNEENKKKLMSCTLPKLVSVVWGTINRSEERAKK